MQVIVKKWGNSAAVRMPVALMEAARPHLDDNVEVRFGNRRCFVGAMVMGDEALLGAIPMEDMDLVVRPMTREVMVNPSSPNIPSSLAKGVA